MHYLQWRNEWCQETERGQKVGQPHSDTTGPTSADESRAKGTPLVLIKLSNIGTVQAILKEGNKRIKSFNNNKIRIVNDVSKITQKKRKKLLAN